MTFSSQPRQRDSTRPWYNREWIIKSLVWVGIRPAVLASCQDSCKTSVALKEKSDLDYSYIVRSVMWCLSGAADFALMCWSWVLQCTRCPSTCLACFTLTASRERAWTCFCRWRQRKKWNRKEKKNLKATLFAHVYSGCIESHFTRATKELKSASLLLQ